MIPYPAIKLDKGFVKKKAQHFGIRTESAETHTIVKPTNPNVLGVWSAALSLLN